MRKVEHPPHDILVANVEGTFYAIENGCPHSGMALSTGTLADHRVICPAHRWEIDLRDGKVVTEVGKGTRNPTYRVDVVDGDVVISAAPAAKP